MANIRILSGYGKHFDYNIQRVADIGEEAMFEFHFSSKLLIRSHHIELFAVDCELPDDVLG